MDPHSYSDLAQGQISHIDFNLDVDFSTCTIRGTAIYSLASTVKGSFYLDTRDIHIDSVERDGQALSWSLEDADPLLGSRLELHDLENGDQFTIKYSTGPSATALQWLVPAQTAGGDHPFLFSQCQAIHARSVFPCQDSPAVRFTYSAAVAVPAPLTAVMAAMAGRTWEEGIRRHFEFQMPQPIPAYLFALAVGELASEDLSPRCRLYAEPVTLPRAAWEFAETETSLKIAEGLFGPYDWDRYDMLVLPPSFPYGGMENPRLTFLTPTLITGDRSLTNVITHELAHSWTGNLVTNATWEDFWLNEGWTVYGERRILEAQYGSSFAGLAAALGYQQLCMALETFSKGPDDSRLKRSLAGLDPEGVVMTVAYEKGFAFLVALERAVGRDRFDKFVANYMAEFRFRSLTTEEFIVFLKQQLPGVESLVKIDEWVYGTGLPADQPEFPSVLFDEVNHAVEAAAGGALPDEGSVQGWNALQVELFLRSVPPTLSVPDCRVLEHLFALEQSKNAEHLASFYLLAIRCGDQTVLPRANDFLAENGRLKFIVPIYLALARTSWGRELAEEIFVENRGRYHPIALQKIETILNTTETP
jgi:leukotriene A-4 hydrolase/aminopeptidase